MKVFDTIKAERLRQVPVLGRVVNMTASSEILKVPNAADHFEWKYKLALECFFTGPETAKDHFYNQARRMIAEELYGELVVDLARLNRILMEEGVYRGPRDPATSKIRELIEKIRQ